LVTTSTAGLFLPDAWFAPLPLVDEADIDQWAAEATVVLQIMV
jgi:hypothetical protein